jgi:hypothetical protein
MGLLLDSGADDDSIDLIDGVKEETRCDAVFMFEQITLSEIC